MKINHAYQVFFELCLFNKYRNVLTRALSFGSLLWLSAFSSSAFSDETRNLNDLSHRRNANLGVSVITKSMHDGTIEAFYLVNHPYTNTLECEVRVSVPVRGPNGDRVIQATLRNEYVFPQAAFPGSPFSYQIDVASSLDNGEFLIPGYSKQIPAAASCHGFAPTKRLPRSVCTVIVNNHDEMCSFAEGFGKYPVTRNGQFLGICDCP